MMTEAEYQELVARAKQLVASIQSFPVFELNDFADKHHPEDKSLASKVWAAYLETGDW